MKNSERSLVPERNVWEGGVQEYSTCDPPPTLGSGSIVVGAGGRVLEAGGRVVKVVGKAPGDIRVDTGGDRDHHHGGGCWGRQRGTEQSGAHQTKVIILTTSEEDREGRSEGRRR